jgi:hypothetical protein
VNFAMHKRSRAFGPTSFQLYPYSAEDASHLAQKATSKMSDVTKREPSIPSASAMY